jgi:hypothetical protein
MEEMVTEGIVSMQDLAVVSHKRKHELLPRQLRVRDCMTKSVALASEVARLLLSANFHGAPARTGVDKFLMGQGFSKVGWRGVAGIFRAATVRERLNRLLTRAAQNPDF